MNSKQLKYLTLFEEMSKADVLSENTAKKYLSSFINLDFTLALDVWDYVCTTRESALNKNEAAAVTWGVNALKAFYAQNAQKTVKALCDNAVVRRAVYQYCNFSTDNEAFNILTDLLLSNKLAPAEEIFKCLVKNERIEYGPFMKNLLERLFIEILKKSSTKKIEMSRKLASLMLTYVGKIKTDEKAMLTQRIKEIM